MLTKFKKGITITEEISKDTEMQEEFEWKPLLSDDKAINDIARKFINENGEQLERIVGRKVQTK